MGKQDLKSMILGAVDIQEKVVSVPEWDCKVLIRGMDGEERSETVAEISALGKGNRSKIYPIVLTRTLRDPETKELIFSVEDGPALTKKSGAVLERLATIAGRLSGITPSAVEEAEKNSDSDTPS